MLQEGRTLLRIRDGQSATICSECEVDAWIIACIISRSKIDDVVSTCRALLREESVRRQDKAVITAKLEYSATDLVGTELQKMWVAGAVTACDSILKPECLRRWISTTALVLFYGIAMNEK